jgi:hypothetical protein
MASWKLTLEERLWSHVVMSGDCWLWTGNTRSDGYGTLCVNGKKTAAHRLSWILAHGEIPKGDGFHGTCVLHTCDNRKCVNPAHLFLGTQADNLGDMTQKGRALHPRNDTSFRAGERHPNARLSETQVIAIRSDPRIEIQIARAYGVGLMTINHIRHRRTWKHVS